MIKDIHIKNYCGITDLKINDCKRINLLVGKNGIGKTTILNNLDQYHNAQYHNAMWWFKRNFKLKLYSEEKFQSIKSKIYLYDEIENGLHHSVIKDFWLYIIKIALVSDVQIFATTHSYEMIEALVEASKETNFIKQDEIRLFKIAKRGNKTLVGSYNAEEIEAKIKAGLEIR